MGNDENNNAQENNRFIPSFEFNRSKSHFLFDSSGSSGFINNYMQQIQNSISPNENNIDPDKTKSRTNPSNEINKGKELNIDNNTNNFDFDYIKPPQIEYKQNNKNKIFEIKKIKRGRGRKKNKKKFHNSDEIGNATKKFMISFINDLNQNGQTLAKNSEIFKYLRLRKLYKPTITKVTQIKNNTKDDIGIFASHSKMRDLINSKIATIFTDYTFPKRVMKDINLKEIKNTDYKIQKKEELLQHYKKHILNIANIKENDAFVKFLNYKALDFLKIYIDYDGKGQIIKEIKLDDNIIINSKVFGPKKDAFKNYSEIRKNLIKIIDNESRDR